jgi:hypothetical protein
MKNIYTYILLLLLCALKIQAQGRHDSVNINKVQELINSINLPLNHLIFIYGNYYLISYEEENQYKLDYYIEKYDYLQENIKKIKWNF